MNEIKLIEISKVKANKHFVNDRNLQELANSIEESGLIHPILVKEINGEYEIISGERRLEAIKSLNKDKIEAIIVNGDEDELASVALIDNMKKSMTAIEEAKAIKKLMKTRNLTQADVAKRLDLKQSTVANKLRLLKLPENIQEAVINKQITERHARALLKVKEEDLQKTFEIIMARGYNVKRTEEYIKALNEKGRTKVRGFSSSYKLGVNTIKESYDLCRNSGLDADYQVTEYENEVKIVIRFKK